MPGKGEFIERLHKVNFLEMNECITVGMSKGRRYTINHFILDAVLRYNNSLYKTIGLIYLYFKLMNVRWYTYRKIKTHRQVFISSLFVLSRCMYIYINFAKRLTTSIVRI